ncbi:FAD-dependent oxidoreductase [Alistipes sp.]|uniref:FAD-dependent oxidoreductase n=1 Tax=Alistipes sp. TaxID=1872444 RepID=UPI003AF00244
MKEYDALIIGFGKAGKTLAGQLAARGWSVALVERSQRMYGGTCINIGCIPTKFLIHKASLAAASRPQSFGQRQDYYRQSIAEKKALVESLRELNYRKLADNPLIDLWTGEGSFISPHEVAVKGARSVELLAGRRIILDTGSETVIPPIRGLTESNRVYTSTTIMELERLPHRLAVIGGGYIGLEFASMYASFGSAVTVLESASELLPHEDRDVAEAVRGVLEKRGIAFRTGTRVAAVQDTVQGVRIDVAGEAEAAGYALEADAVLLATGRRPATGGLNLKAAGIQTDERGAIRVDEHLETSAPGVYAAGDVTGGPQFTYISLDDSRIIRDALFGEGVRTTLNRGPVPYSVYIEPPLSHVGLHEAEATGQGLDVRVNRIDVSTIPRARTMSSAEGLLKAVIDRSTDLVVGCTLFGPSSVEVIDAVALAMRHGITARELSEGIYTHPSMTETFNDLFA